MQPTTSAPGDWRLALDQWVSQPIIQRTIIVLIVVNAVILGMETSPAIMADWGPLLLRLDSIILGVFVLEIALLIAARGWRYFKDPWGIFDVIVVGIALLPASGPFAVLRALRVLRVLRLVTKLPSMRRVVGGLLTAIPGLGSVFAIIAIVFYVASVIATKLFSQSFPEWFGSLDASAYTLFQVMTLESWSMGIARPVMEVYPQAWIFFVIFILVSTFTMLNLFIAVIVNAITSTQAQENHRVEDAMVARVDADTEIMQQEMAKVREELAQLRRLLEAQQK
ncbi:MAG: ion transporter [Betaproteobacteria bacterium]|nr:ion transporter [Betaproteobacteria bacterium]